SAVGIILRLEDSFEPFPDAEDLPAESARRIDRGVNDGIEPGRVAAARVDRDSLDVFAHGFYRLKSGARNGRRGSYRFREHRSKMQTSWRAGLRRGRLGGRRRVRSTA